MPVKDRIKAMDELRKYEGGTIVVSYFNSYGYQTKSGRFVRFDPYVDVCIKTEEGTKSIPFAAFVGAIEKIKVGRKTVYENEHAKDLPCKTAVELIEDAYVSLRKRTFGEFDKLKEIMDQER